MANDYATLAELKLRLNISSADSDRDTALEAMLDAAAAAIDRYCNRPDGFVADSTASARVYPGSGAAVQRIDECVAITTVAVKDSTTDDDYTDWAATDWQAFRGDPNYPDFNTLPYTMLMVTADGDYAVFTSGRYRSRGGFRPYTLSDRRVPTVQVTAKWGYAVTCPAQITEATVLQAARWWKRAQSSWADTLGNADVGTLMYRKSVDPDLQMMLDNGRFVRPSIG